ncbi:hypothetical protein BaRGS_00001561 [Batillaria attramentaria]|uniref:Uncharacterized protein n=1 Tax=Batillaria attramentaria TaxID=370345 RepID=A0ABD0M854_9CAEN
MDTHFVVCSVCITFLTAGELSTGSPLTRLSRAMEKTEAWLQNGIFSSGRAAPDQIFPRRYCIFFHHGGMASVTAGLSSICMRMGLGSALEDAGRAGA